MNRVLRGSATPYLSLLVVAVVQARLVQYLWPDVVLVKGQAPSLVFSAVLIGLAFIAWWFYEGHRSPSRVLTWFVITMSVAWAVHMAILIAHSDNFNHLAWLYVPVLAMLLLKTPSLDEVWSALTLMGWLVIAAMVIVRALEMLGVIPIYFVPAYVVEFDNANYWLPFSGHFGIEGKWTGPFGASAHTAMMGAFLVVLGMARWTRSSAFFIAAGALVYLLTAARTVLLAVVVAGLILLIFSRSRYLAKAPMWLRFVGLACVLAVGTVVMFMSGPGLTGRQNIWPAFLELWYDSPLIGVGQPGIEAAGGLAARTDEAHNIFIDELARYGLLGLVTQVAALGIGTFAVFRAAARGFAGPAAIVTAYFALAMTDVRNDWIQPSLTGLLFVLAVVAAESGPSEDADGEDSSVPASEPGRVP